MIRTEFNLRDGATCWLLVSQVEHARISGQLARRCGLSFLDASGTFFGQGSSTFEELIAAIDRHDDGWAKWDADPRLDNMTGAPLSFRELPLEYSLANWTGSIESAATVGPLAGWMVASHFRALLQASTKECDHQLVERWLAEIDASRLQWLTNWQRQMPERYSLPVARTALLWLQAFDLLSLWLCSVAWNNKVDAEPYRAMESTDLEICLSLVSPALPGTVCRVQVEPWLFADQTIELHATALVAPARKYESSGELLAATVEETLRWMIIPGASG